MKKLNTIRCLAIIFAIIFCFSASTATAANNDVASTPILTEYSNDFYVTQAESINVYNDLLDNFNASRSATDKTKTDKQEYPDYFGGAYINHENGALVIKTKNASVQSSLQSITNKKVNATAKVEWEQCDISYNEMKAIVNDLSEQLPELEEMGISIGMMYIDVVAEKVVVGVRELSENKKTIISQLTDCDFINFTDVNKITNTVAIGPGYPATDSNGITSTIGFAATRLGVPGYVIAGHAGDVGDSFSSQGYTLGNITHSAYTYMTTADAAFVRKTNANVSLSNIAKNNYVITSAEEGYLPQGTIVWKYGNRTQTTSGYTIGTDAIYHIVDETEEYRIFNCVVATYDAERGDSGGPVMVYTGNNEYKLYGIQSSIGNYIHNGEDIDVSFFCTYGNIVDELNVVCVTD